MSQKLSRLKATGDRGRLDQRLPGPEASWARRPWGQRPPEPEADVAGGLLSQRLINRSLRPETYGPEATWTGG